MSLHRQTPADWLTKSQCLCEMVREADRLHTDLKTYLAHHCLCDVCRPRHWQQRHQSQGQAPSTATWYIPGYDVGGDATTSTDGGGDSMDDGDGWRVTSRPLECCRVACHTQCDLSTYMSADQAKAYHKLTDYFKPV